MTITPKERELIFIVFFLAATAVFYAISIQREIANGIIIEQKISEYQESIKPFLGLALNAKSFAIYDMDKEEFVYKNNAEVKMPLASLAKVMSAIIIMENVPADHVFTMSAESLSEAGDNKLLVDEKWKRDDLLAFTLVESSNDAVLEMAKEAGAIMDPSAPDPVAVFVNAMNEKAKELKLTNFEFSNPSGLDLSTGKNGGYGNARNMAKLFTYAVKTYPALFAPTSKSAPVFSSLDAEHTAKNTNPIVNDIPGLIASKTGFTNIAGGNLVVAFNDPNGRKLVAVVMGSTFDARFSDVKMISDKTVNPQAGF